jgi:hypothetical protein
MTNKNIKIKFKDILKFEKFFNKIYIIYNEDEPIYVGMSGKQCVQTRLLSHLVNYYSRSPASSLSKFLFNYEGDYFEFRIELLELDSIARIVGSKQHCLKCAERNLYDFYRKNKGFRVPGNARSPNYCQKRI